MSAAYFKLTHADGEVELVRIVRPFPDAVLSVLQANAETVEEITADEAEQVARQIDAFDFPEGGAR